MAIGLSRFPAFLNLEKILNTILVCIFVTCFFLIIFDQIWLKWIPIDTDGLKVLAKVGSIKGDVDRRLQNDTLSLPIHSEQNLYENDTIKTGSGSSVEIRFDAENFIVQEPETILKIRWDPTASCLHMRLFAGNLETHMAKDSLVKMQYGAKTYDVQIRKGTYLIRNSGFGIQITEFATNNLVKAGHSDDTNAKAINSEISELDSEAPEKTAEIEELDPAPDSESLEDESTVNKTVPLKLPYPPRKTVVLFQGDSSIFVAAKTNCEGDCSLTIHQDGVEIFSKNFIDGEFAHYELQLRSGRAHTLNWKFKDDFADFEDSFQVKPYTDENFQKALDQGFNVEFL